MHDDEVRHRFARKRAEGMQEILSRIEQVEVARMYRIVGVLEETARAIDDDLTPRLGELKKRWEKYVLWSQLVVLGTLALAVLVVSIWTGAWDGLTFAPSWLPTLQASGWLAGLLGTLAAVVAYIHFKIRRLSADRIKRALLEDDSLNERKF